MKFRPLVYAMGLAATLCSASFVNAQCVNCGSAVGAGSADCGVQYMEKTVMVPSIRPRHAR